MSDKKAEAVSAERLQELIDFYETNPAFAHNDTLRRHVDVTAALRELQSLRFKVIDLEAEVEHQKDMVHLVGTALDEAEDEIDELDRQLHGESPVDEDENTEILDTGSLYEH